MSESTNRTTKSGGAIRTMLITTGTLLGVVVFSLFGVGGSYAYLNSAATGAGAVLQAGTAELTVSAGALSMTNLYPGGPARTAGFTVSNNGSVPAGVERQLDCGELRCQWTHRNSEVGRLPRHRYAGHFRVVGRCAASRRHHGRVPHCLDGERRTSERDRRSVIPHRQPDGSPAVTRERMPRRLRNAAIGVGLTIFLALSATGVHAAWTASTSKSATASNSAVGLTSSGISALGATYATQNQPAAVKLITLTNTGSTPLTISRVSVSDTNVLSGVIRLALWQKPAGDCQTSAPTGAYTTLLDSGVKTLSGMPTVAAGSSVHLCVITTFTGDPGTHAGQSTSPSLAFAGTVGANWSATHSAQAFTQTVSGVPNPLNVTCTNRVVGGKNVVEISWSAVSGASYRVVAGKTVNTTSLTVELGNSDTTGGTTSARIHAVINGELSSGVVVPITVSGSSVTCGT